MQSVITDIISLLEEIGISILSISLLLCDNINATYSSNKSCYAQKSLTR